MRFTGIRTTSSLGAAIRSAREQRGLTQAQLASRAGSSRLWLSMMENGKSPRGDVGLVLSTLQALGLSIELNDLDLGTPEERAASQAIEDLW